MTDITWILLGIIVLAFGGYAMVIRPWLLSKISSEQLTQLTYIAKVAVQAAEQIITIVTGKDKKTFAMEYVKTLLTKLHLTFDDNAISTAIEAQVYEMNKEKEKKEPVGEEQ